MSSCLWATEAARRKRKPPLFPGSARFNAGELHHGVQKTHDGVASFEDQISPLTSDLNSLIDLINDGNKEKVFSHVDYMASTKLESEAQPESSIDESSSRPWSAGGSATPDVSLSGVKTERKENTLSLAEAIRSEVGEELLKTKIEEKEHDISSPKPSPSLERDEHTTTKGQKPEDNLSEESDIEAAPDAVEHNSPAQPVEPKPSSGLEVTQEMPQAESSPRRNSHSTEANDLPHNIPDELEQDNDSPKEKPKAVRVKVEESDSEVSDTSFQAISSAIRKSFAGKVSIGATGDNGPLYSPGLTRKDTIGGPRRSSDKNGPIHVKQEKEESILPRESSTNGSSSKSAPISNRISKRTSVFVSLPSREPIAYSSNKRHSIKVKMEEQESDPHTSRVNSALTQAAKAEPAPPSRIPVDSDIPRAKKEPSLHNNSRPRQDVSSSKTASHGAVTTGNKNKTPSLKNRSSTRDSRRVSPERVPQLSSAPSSRSPTRYGTKDGNNGETGRYSVATSTTASTPGERRYSTDDQKPEAVSNLSKSSSKSAKEKRNQNKFLTTTLNPQKPPQFNPVKTKIKNPSPIKRFLDTDIEKERLELKERRLKMNELASNKVILAPSSTEKNSRAEAALQQRRSSPTRKRAASPVKREPSPSRKEAQSSNKFRKVEESVNASRRRAAVGNAQPLPEAARGRFVKERPRQEKPRVDEKRTPIKIPNSSRSGRTPINVGASGSPAIRGDALPEIPSDDESLKKQKYFKNWANTPELQKLIQVNHKINPVDIFGEVADLRMDEVFESTSTDKK
ncbi:hypothetical protein CXQ85_003290 [Candidozyma haemuli]|uniref:Inner centromere protein ARK-binding domain-containing protein n=1 Tax=Candidozyma haemuli TaxID=45357 RepID=A0A2V1AP10_9ASCO|nr:hypothetical protein CXQ85_003290 [[Candida] haemuloni]PVH19444.1 hypothetical protein CXQ85_003290 [[Candida] haemuloni]